MPRTLLCLLLFLFQATFIFGQADSITRHYKNNVSFHLGPIHSRFIDQGFTDSRLLFRGTNLNVGLAYGRETSKSIFNFSIDASSGKATSKESNLPIDFYAIHLYVEYLRKLKDNKAGGRSAFLFGLHLASRNIYLQNEPVLDNIDILSLHGLYLSGKERIILNKKQQLQVACLIPAIVYTNQVLWNGGASRYGYDDRDHPLHAVFSNGKFSWFDVLHNVECKIDYTLSIGKKVDFEGRYELFYANKTIERPVRIYSNVLLVGLKFRF